MRLATAARSSCWAGSSRSAGRALRPWLFKHLKPATAGIVGFLIRLSTMMVVVVTALRVAGPVPRELALGGAVTAVVVDLVSGAVSAVVDALVPYAALRRSAKSLRADGG